MPHIRKLLAGFCLTVAPAWADISRPTAAGQSGAWPQWAVVAVTFTLFIGLIVLISRFFRGERGSNDKGDGGGLFG